MRARGKIRYSHEGADCTIRMIDDNTLECKFDEPQRQLHQDRHLYYMMVNMFLVEELSYNEHKRKGSGCSVSSGRRWKRRDFRTKRHISKAFWTKRAKQGCRKSTMITVRDALRQRAGKIRAESAGRKDGAGYNRNERTEAFHGR